MAPGASLCRLTDNDHDRAHTRTVGGGVDRERIHHRAQAPCVGATNTFARHRATPEPGHGAGTPRD